MVLDGIRLYWMVLDGIRWYWMVLGGFGWYWMELDGIEWYWMVLGDYNTVINHEKMPTNKCLILAAISSPIEPVSGPHTRPMNHIPGKFPKCERRAPNTIEKPLTNYSTISMSDQ